MPRVLEPLRGSFQNFRQAPLSSKQHLSVSAQFCSPNMAENKKATHSFWGFFVLGISIDTEARDLLSWSRSATVQ